ncbi:MAG: sensor histidine kinase [Pseudomonadales bacterium]|nr:sensor histidine kinase [Pseudomonadales bacterium]
MIKIHTGILLLFLYALIPDANAMMELSPKADEYDFAAFSEYSFDETEVIDQLRFLPLQKTKIDFGIQKKVIWLKTEIVNHSDRQNVWLLNLNTRFMNGMTVTIDRNGQLEELLRNGEETAFKHRPINQPKLALSLELPPGKTVTLYIRYWSRGTTALPVLLQTPERYAETTHRESIKYTGFYSVVGLLLIFALFQFIFVNNRLQISYILYVGSAALYVFHMDGLSFKYLWPDLPGWNAFSSLPLGLIMTALGIQFSRVFLEMKHNLPKLDRLCRLIFPLVFCILAYGIFFDSVQSKKLALNLNLIVVILGVSAGVISYYQGVKSARFYVVGWVLICLASAWTNIAHLLPWSLPVASSFDMIRLGIVADALMFQLALADKASEAAEQRNLLIRSEKKALKKQQIAERSVYKAEQELLEAMAIATQKSRELETTSHDLKQPLASMRLALSQMKNQKEMDGTVVGRFEKSVDFLEFLIRNSGQTYSEPKSSHAEFGPDSAQRRPAEFPANKIISSIEAMFKEEAEMKNLQFRCRPSSLSIVGVPNDILRIISNLVSNAIRYTKRGKIFVGCKRRGRYLAIIVADTGTGISEQEKTSIFEYGKRGSMHEMDGTGDGIGLPIAYQLAEKNGYRIRLDSRPGSGSLFSLEVPLA